MVKYLIVLISLSITIITTYYVAVWQGLDSFTFAWVLNLTLMAYTLSITQAVKPGLKSPYYNSQKWENGGEIYRWVGVNGFRKLLVWVGWEKLNKKANPVKKNLAALKQLEYNTRLSEFNHLIIFFIVLGFTSWVGISDGFRHLLWLVGLNVILNIYPIGVQRYNRPRLQKAIHRMNGLTTEQKIARDL